MLNCWNDFCCDLDNAGKAINSSNRISRLTLRLLRLGINNFQRHFELEPTNACFVPVRLNILGDDCCSDDGLLLSMAMPLGTLVVGAPTKDQKARIINYSGCLNEPSTCEFNTNETLLPRGSLWSKYIKSVFVNYQQKIPGFNAAIVTNTLPHPGFGRMASLHLAILSFLETISSPQTKMNQVEKALLCQKAESEFCGIESHLSNYFTSSVAKENFIFLVDCWRKKMTGIPINDDTIFLLTFKEPYNKNTISLPDTRDGHIKKAAEILQLKSIRQAIPYHINLLEKASKDNNVIECGSYAINELYRILTASRAVYANDMQLFGKTLVQSYFSLNQIFRKKVQSLLDELALFSLQCEGVYGCRVIEKSNCLLTLVQSSSVNKLVCQFNNVENTNLSHYKCKPSDGILKLKIAGDMTIDALAKPSALSKRLIN